MTRNESSNTKFERNTFRYGQLICSDNGNHTYLTQLRELQKYIRLLFIGNTFASLSCFFNERLRCPGAGKQGAACDVCENTRAYVAAFGVTCSASIEALVVGCVFDNVHSECPATVENCAQWSAVITNWVSPACVTQPHATVSLVVWSCHNIVSSTHHMARLLDS